MFAQAVVVVFMTVDYLHERYSPEESAIRAFFLSEPNLYLRKDNQRSKKTMAMFERLGRLAHLGSNTESHVYQL